MLISLYKKEETISLEETIFFLRLPPLRFTLSECKLSEEIFKRFMDDGFVPWPKNAYIDVFRELLNKLHPSLKFAVEKGKISFEKNFYTFVQVLNVLDVSIILHQNDRLETVMLCFIKKFTRMTV